MFYQHISFYGLVYVLATLLWIVVSLKQRSSQESISDCLYIAIYLALWTLIGARLGYVFWYEAPWYLQHPLEIVQVYKGGMSFHGAVVGAVFAACFFGRKEGITRQLLDRLTLCALVMLPLGRLANFWNGEVFGRVTDVPWAVIFTNVDMQPRHPSQLYEALAEGPLCALLLYLCAKRGWVKYAGQRAAVFAMGYSFFRFCIEYYREPDRTVGLILGTFSLGQILCLVFFGIGMVLYWAIERKEDHKQAQEDKETKEIKEKHKAQGKQ